MPHTAAEAQALPGADAAEVRSILHIANSLGTGGAEKFVFELALRQAGSGRSVGVVCFERPTELAYGNRLAAEREARLAEAGIDTAYLGRAARQNLPRGALLLRRLVPRFAPDVIHCHLLRGSAALALSGRRRPSIFTHHNTPLHVPEGLFRLMSRGTDRYVGISEAGARVLTAVTGRAADTVVNGIDLTRFSPGPGTGDPFTVLSVGDLREQKNYPYLIEIAKALTAALPDRRVRFRIAGEGAERPRLERDIRARRLEGAVELLGSRTDVPALMQAADAYLLTSRFEGMPLALIEAMASGLPVVATDVGACRDLIGEGESGFLVPLDRPPVAAGRLRTLIEQPERRRQMSRKALERASAYSIEATHEGYLAVYRRAIAGPGRSRPR